MSSTYYWLGYLGLGIIQGNFPSKNPLSPISGLVEKIGAIGSHSYGFTAGANYRE
jgi:hypothetical protein